MYANNAGTGYANANIFYLFLGAQQQWGYGNSESTQTFPIKFTNSVIGIYGSKRAINYEYTFAATSITNTNFFMSTRNSEGSSRVIACNWLAIGQQQTKNLCYLNPYTYKNQFWILNNRQYCIEFLDCFGLCQALQNKLQQSLRGKLQQYYLN